jgi:hypothetical protein
LYTQNGQPRLAIINGVLEVFHLKGVFIIIVDINPDVSVVTLIMEMLLWIGTSVVVIAIFIGIGLCIGILMRRFVRPNRFSLACLLLASLLPWYQHHRSFIDTARFPFSGHGTNDLTLVSANLGPSVVALLVILSIAMPKKFRYFAVTVPGLAFCITYPLTFRLVYNEVGFINFDNIATIWLFMASIAITAFFISYLWPCNNARL